MKYFLLLAVITSFCLYAVTAQNQDPQGAGGAQTTSRSGAAGGFIEGTAAWNMEMVREYYKREYQLDVKAEPDAFPRQEMLDQLNPDFKNRFKAAMSIYQSMGGGELGILPGPGGLRTAQSQIDLFKKCRRVKKGTDGRPAGNGSERGHWEEIPAGERTAANCPDGVVTGSWGVNGWHAYGMAADVAWFRNGVFTRSESGIGNALVPNFASPLHGNKWHLTTDLIGDIGLCPGLWWSERKKDKPHLELHPRLSHAPFPENADLPRLQAGVAGTALTNDQFQGGYKWKIPEKVFIRRFNSRNLRLTQYLTVYEFSAKDDWIYLKKMRTVDIAGNGAWYGTWTTFEPEIRLFPAWIPTPRFDRNEKDRPDDVRWRGKSGVTIDTFVHQVDSGGKISTDRRQKIGGAHFYPDLSVKDLQKEADLKFWRDAHAKEQWVDLQKISVYDVEASIQKIEAGEASMETITTKGRQTDDEGYTRNDWNTTEEGFILPSIGSQFGWDRDTGEVGVGDVAYAIDYVTVFSLKPLRCGEDGDCTVVSSQLPGGAFDKETPPPWQPIRIKPGHNPKLDWGKP